MVMSQTEHFPSSGMSDNPLGIEGSPAVKVMIMRLQASQMASDGVPSQDVASKRVQEESILIIFLFVEINPTINELTRLIA